MKIDLLKNTENLKKNDNDFYLCFYKDCLKAYSKVHYYY